MLATRALILSLPFNSTSLLLIAYAGIVILGGGPCSSPSGERLDRRNAKPKPANPSSIQLAPWLYRRS
jgi:hypothetical protein